MRRNFLVLLIMIMIFSVALPGQAASGTVTYAGDAGEFIFTPGSTHSLTDLFPNFKDVMPGDSLTQKITVKNNASKEVKVKIYVRALGAHADSTDFLSQLGLRVQKSQDNTMAYMFDSAASETAQMTDWVYLGMLYSGGEVNLDVILDVPVTLDDRYSAQVGYLDWEFMVEEFPVEDDDPVVPPTGDSFNIGVWVTVFASACVLLILLFLLKRRRGEE